VLVVGLEVILCELLANFSCLYSDDGVISGVVADGTTKHLGPDHALSQAIDVAFQSVVNDQMEKILGTFASRERVTRYDFLEMVANQTLLLWGEHCRFAGRVGCGHDTLSSPLEDHYTTTMMALRGGYKPAMLSM
jgi:hypothetical protein